jgi:hypothetical protein
MSSILNTKHSPPNAIDDNATVATPQHSPPVILTESFVTDAFCQRDHGLIQRYEDFCREQSQDDAACAMSRLVLSAVGPSRRDRLPSHQFR